MRHSIALLLLAASAAHAQDKQEFWNFLEFRARAVTKTAFDEVQS